MIFPQVAELWAGYRDRRVFFWSVLSLLQWYHHRYTVLSWKRIMRDPCKSDFYKADILLTSVTLASCIAPALLWNLKGQCRHQIRLQTYKTCCEGQLSWHAESCHRVIKEWSEYFSSELSLINTKFIYLKDKHICAFCFFHFLTIPNGGQDFFSCTYTFDQHHHLVLLLGVVICEYFWDSAMIALPPPHHLCQLCS